ncbi:hypothetical protein DV738_g4955, partial [Chaetothyriales sp. CBS 135597]
MAANSVDEASEARQEDPLVAALPPATDYLTYLTLLEYQLKPSNLSTLNRLLREDDGTLVEEIGWDLLRLVLPMLHEVRQEASNCVQLIANRDPDELDRDTAAQQSLVFQELLGALSVVHQRIKTKYPSRFLATSLPAALGAYRKLPITVETTAAFLKCLEQLSNPHRPPLPPRASSAGEAGANVPLSPVPLPDPEAASEAHTGSNVASENEKAIIKRLLQAVLVEIIDEFLSSLQYDEEPSMRWTSRLREKLEPGRSVPGKETEQARWQKENGLQARDSLIDQFTKLSTRLDLNPVKELRVATGQDEAPPSEASNSNEEEFDYPTSPSQVPFAITGLIELAAATAFASGQALEAKDINASLLFKSSQTLSKDVTIPFPALQDALCSILYQQLEPSPGSGLSGSTSDGDSSTLVAMLTQSFTAGQDAQTRDDTHHIATKLLHRRQPASDRIEIIKQTIHCTAEPVRGLPIALCPPYLQGTLKAVGVDWLKDEILLRLGQTTLESNDESSLGLDPSVLEQDSELASLIAPDIPVLVAGSPVEADTTTDVLLSLPYYISVLNLACILLSRTSIDNNGSDISKRAERVVRGVEKWSDYLIEQMRVDEEVMGSASDIFALEDACGRAKTLLGKARENTGRGESELDRSENLIISPSAARHLPARQRALLSHDCDAEHLTAMLNTSLRRAARSCTRAQPLPAPRASAPLAAPFPGKGHQRRQSSSKPPVPPNNGSPTIPTSAVKQVGASRSVSKKPAAESRVSKRKAQRTEPREQVQDNWTATLPSVPSTQHLNQKDVNIAVFYATYRPISITGPGPREVNMDDIEKLFEAKPKSRLRARQNDVIYTLSNMIENINEQVENQGATQKADLIKQLTQNNENSKPISIETHGAKQVVKLDIQKLTHHFRPFNVPPPPALVSRAELDLLDAEDAAAAAAFEANEEMLAQDLEAQAGQDLVEAAAALGRRHREKLNAQLAAQEQNGQPAQSTPDVAEVVFNPRSSEDEMQTGSFFTSGMQIEDPKQDDALIRGLRIQDPQRVHRTRNLRRRLGNL